MIINLHISTSKLEKFSVECKSSKGLYFVVWYCRKKCYNNCYFSYQMFVLYDVIFFLWKRSRSCKKLYHIFWIIYLKKETFQNWKFRQKTKPYLVYIFIIMAPVITDTKLFATLVGLFTWAFSSHSLIWKRQHYP